MKLLGCIIIICGCTAYGFFKSYSIQKRCKNLLEFKLILNTLKTEIEFLKNELYTSIKNASKKSVLEKLFYDFADNLKISGVDKAWETSLTENASAFYFTSEDITILKKFSKDLGKTDAKNQIHHIDFISSLIDERYILASEEYKTKSSIYKAYGAAFGILTVLLLI